MKNCHHLFIIALLALSLVIPQAGLAQGKMYWTEQSSNKIQSANLDGSSVTDVVTGLSEAPSGLALNFSQSKLDWTNREIGKIQRANFDGTGVEDVVTGLSDPRGLALDLSAGKIYWTETGAGDERIARSDLDGSNVETLVTGLITPNSITLDLTNGKMYWVDEDAPAIQRANLDGTSVETLVTAGLSEPSGIALDLGAGKMYWCDLANDNIKRANLDGSSVETLVTGLAEPRDIDLDLLEGKMYWTDGNAGKIQRANLDGTSVEDLVTGIGDPVSIALDVAASPNARFASFSGPGGFVVSRSKLISQGQIFSNGNLQFKKGDPTVYNGDLFAVGNIIIDKDNTINGNLRAGGTITIDPKSTVNGTMSPGDPLAPGDPFLPGDPTLPFNIGKGGSLTLLPGDPLNPGEPWQPGDPHYEVNVGNSATLNLSSGEYHFTKLVTNSESVLNFDVSNGAVVLNVSLDLSLGKKVTFNISPGGQANSHLVTIFAFQSSKVVVDKGGYVLGNLNAPNAEVSIGKNVSLRGAVWASQTTVDRDVIVLHHSSPAVLPKQVLLDEEEVASDQSSVTSYQLEQNYPNPFNPSTVISFQLPVISEVKLVIYNTNGQFVRTLYSGDMPAGRFEVEWNGKNESGEKVASGVYLAVFKAGDPSTGSGQSFVAKRKLVLMK